MSAFLRRATGVPITALLPAFVLAFVLAGCAGVDSPRSSVGNQGSFDPRLYPSIESPGSDEIDLWIENRELVRSVHGERLLRVRFSFVSYRGFIGEEDVHRSTGDLFLPVDEEGRAAPLRIGDVVITEYPPGVSLTGFPFYPEYGHRPAVELGVAAAIVDVRGPIARDLRKFANPEDPAGQPFADGEQLGYSMLRSYQETGDPRHLVEWHEALAWFRAIRAVRNLVAKEAAFANTRILLVAQGRGVLSAAQAAAFDPEVRGLVACGWPFAWLDYHFVRWRRWERRARLDPLAPYRPIPWRDSQDLITFLSSSWGRPDPGCPSCEGTGEFWRAQYDLVSLTDHPLSDLRVLRIVGDSDPDLPIDLEARIAAPPEALQSFPFPVSPGALGPGEDHPTGAAFPRGPWNVPRAPPWDDLRYLHDSPSTLANEEASESVLAWIQHLGGYRDVPLVLAFEGASEGDLVVDLAIVEGNATVTDLWLELVDIADGADSDFRHRLRGRNPEAMGWRRVEAFFVGPARDGTHRWRARFPLDLGRNQAYYPVIRTRVGDLSASHSLPVRVFWNLGDPAAGAVRF